MNTRWTKPLCFTENHYSNSNHPPPKKKKSQTQNRKTEPTNSPPNRPTDWLDMTAETTVDHGAPHIELDTLRTSSGTSSLDWTDFSGNSSIVLGPHEAALLMPVFAKVSSGFIQRFTTKCVTEWFLFRFLFGGAYIVSVFLYWWLEAFPGELLFLLRGSLEQIATNSDHTFQTQRAISNRTFGFSGLESKIEVKQLLLQLHVFSF